MSGASTNLHNLRITLVLEWLAFTFIQDFVMLQNINQKKTQWYRNNSILINQAGNKYNYSFSIPDDTGSSI